MDSFGETNILLYLLVLYLTDWWAGHVARIEEGSIAFKILTGIPAGKIP